MFHIVLYQPEIPPNTGNIIRLAANTGCRLHLIKPLGFEVDDKHMRRAGLDYHSLQTMQVWDSYDLFLEQIQPKQVYALSTRGRRRYDQPQFGEGDAFVFGPETRGLPQGLLDAMPTDYILRIPMQAGNRSLNLSNSVAVVIYEAWRQHQFQTIT